MKPIGRRIEVNHVQFEGTAIKTSSHIDADYRVLQVGCNDHFEDSGRVGNGAFEMFQQHEFVERVIPLHQKDPVGSSATQIFVAIVGISTNATFTTSLRIVDLNTEDLQLDTYV